MQFIDEPGLAFPIVFDETGEVTEIVYGVLDRSVKFCSGPDGISRIIMVEPSTETEVVELANRLLAP